MPRRARLALPNAPLHLIQRGNNRQAGFFWAFPDLKSLTAARVDAAQRVA